MQRKAQSVVTKSRSKRAPEHSRFKQINECAPTKKETHQGILQPAPNNTRETAHRTFSAPAKTENYRGISQQTPSHTRQPAHSQVCAPAKTETYLGIPQQAPSHTRQPRKVQDLQSQIGEFENFIHHTLASRNMCLASSLRCIRCRLQIF